MNLKSVIREIPDFPEKGIGFKDITTLIKDKEAFKYAVDLIVQDLKDKDIDYIVGPEARGFLMGAAVAYALGVGFVPIRKKGKLPAEVVRKEYSLEYGTDILEIHKDAIEKGSNVAIVDDLMATGGTVCAVAELLEEIGANVKAMEFLIELSFLKPNEKVKKYHVNSLVKYESE